MKPVYFLGRRFIPPINPYEVSWSPGRDIPMPFFVQRDYQFRITRDVVAFFEGEDGHSAMIEAPTGSGKTVMALVIAKYFFDKYGWRTNWVAMRHVLLEQVMREGVRLFGKSFANDPFLTPVSMFNRNPPPADMVIVDEGHHDATASAARLHSIVRPKKILGLSATPKRTDRIRLAFQKTFRDAGIHRLIREGWLSKYDHWSIPEYTVESVVETYAREPEKWGKTVMFMRSIAQCREVVEAFRLKNIDCRLVSSQQDDESREATLAAFDRGEFPVLSNVYLLTEGFDSPSLKTVFIRDSSRLPTTQCAGRPLRLFEGKERANVVQSVKTHWPFTRTAMAESINLWNDTDKAWTVLEGHNEIVEEAVNASLAALVAAPDIELPPFILAMEKKLASQQRRRRRARDMNIYEGEAS